ncbi:unnamed protein product [Pleuronectes platessa]|uniref:Uncharacterized protein n=1 Tax=Pleuronectes platessa TaxID=8262 RepID=A0A9N7U7C4_PLEPL|nr:unnamed protein product [Pleuronectes platessa]
MTMRCSSPVWTGSGSGVDRFWFRSYRLRSCVDRFWCGQVQVLQAQVLCGQVLVQVLCGQVLVWTGSGPVWTGSGSGPTGSGPVWTGSGVDRFRSYRFRSCVDRFWCGTGSGPTGSGPVWTGSGCGQVLVWTGSGPVWTGSGVDRFRFGQVQVLHVQVLCGQVPVLQAQVLQAQVLCGQVPVLHVPVWTGLLLKVV